MNHSPDSPASSRVQLIASDQTLTELALRETVQLLMTSLSSSSLPDCHALDRSALARVLYLSAHTPLPPEFHSECLRLSRLLQAGQLGIPDPPRAPRLTHG